MNYRHELPDQNASNIMMTEQSIENTLHGIELATGVSETFQAVVRPFGLQVMGKLATEATDRALESNTTPTSPQPTWTAKGGRQEADDGGTGPGDETAGNGFA